MSEIVGTRKIFDKSKRMEDAHFIKLPSNLKSYIYVDGYKAEMNYLYAIIVDYYNADEGVAYPSMLRLSREYGKSQPTTRDHLKVLQSVGLIDYTDINGKKYYVPYEPLDQTELFREDPKTHRNYLDAIRRDEEEHARSVENWVRDRSVT